MIYIEIPRGKRIEVSSNVIKIIKMLMKGHELIIDGSDMFYIKEGRYSCPFERKLSGIQSIIMRLVNEGFLYSEFEDRKAQSLRIGIYSDVELIAYHSTRVTINHAIDLENESNDDIDPPGWWHGIK